MALQPLADCLPACHTFRCETALTPSKAAATRGVGAVAVEPKLVHPFSQAKLDCQGGRPRGAAEHSFPDRPV